MRANERALLETWNSSDRLRKKYTDEFIYDALFLEISGICSAAQTVNKKECSCWMFSH